MRNLFDCYCHKDYMKALAPAKLDIERTTMYHAQSRCAKNQEAKARLPTEA